MKTYHYLCLLFALAAPLSAIEDTPENRAVQADRYLEAAPPADMFAAMAGDIAGRMVEAQREPFKQSFVRHLDSAAITARMKAALVRHLTADELAALADFYGSALGHSAMKKYGAYLADVTPEINALVRTAEGRAYREVAGNDDREDAPPAVQDAGASATEAAHP